MHRFDSRTIVKYCSCLCWNSFGAQRFSFKSNEKTRAANNETSWNIGFGTGKIQRHSQQVNGASPAGKTAKNPLWNVKIRGETIGIVLPTTKQAVEYWTGNFQKDSQRFNPVALPPPNGQKSGLDTVFLNLWRLGFGVSYWAIECQSPYHYKSSPCQLCWGCSVFLPVVPVYNDKLHSSKPR